jgi:hypothetical protein
VVVITAKQLTVAERGLLAVRTVIEKGDSIDRDIAAAIAKAVGRRPTPPISRCNRQAMT